MWEARSEKEKRRKRHASAGKKGRWDEPHSPLPRNDHLWDSALPGGQAPPVLGHTDVAPETTVRVPRMERARSAARTEAL